MKRLNSIFSSDELRQRAAEALEESTKDERKSWMEHPCTRAMLLTLQGDYIDYHQNWEDGGFVGPSSDATDRENAKALGAIEAIRLIVNYVEEMPDD